MNTHKRTKIVCTIGPASWSPEMLKRLALAGMNVARLNHSHGTNVEKLEHIKIIRKLSEELGKPIAILADLSGPKMRLGKFEGIIDIKKGDKVDLSIEPKDQELPMQFDLAPHVKPDQRIFLNDGLVDLKVVAVKGKTVSTISQNDGWVSSNKGVNVPDTYIKGAAFTEKDRTDAEFAMQSGVDYVALSFVQTAEDLDELKKMIHKYQSKAKIVVKIEKSDAVKNIEEIVNATDAVMVARGDLGIEIAASDVPLVQQKLIRLCRLHQKPVIVATQMLESMTENPRPTRAETSDVANAVLDQADAVMLSAESASGKYPVEAVITMKDIILAVESSPDYHREFPSFFSGEEYHKLLAKENEDFVRSAIVANAALMAKRLDAKAIIVPTVTGRIASLLSSFRPNAQIVAVAHTKETWNQLALVWGVRSVIASPIGNFDRFLEKVVNVVEENGFAKSGDQVIIVTGSTVGLSGATDTIKVTKLP